MMRDRNTEIVCFWFKLCILSGILAVLLVHPIYCDGMNVLGKIASFLTP